MNLIKRIINKIHKKPLKIGDYVFVSRWLDEDPNDPWYVSTVKEIIINNRGTY